MSSSVISAASRFSPMAPPVYGGLVTPEGPVYYDYPEDIVLTGSATNVQDVIKTDTDAPFHLCAILPDYYTSIQFSFQININGVYYMSEFPVLAGNLVGDPAAPPPVLGKFIIPAGANINFVFNELSGNTNTIQLILRGMKLYGYGSGSKKQEPRSPFGQL
jgi:hypothetical protein